MKLRLLLWVVALLCIPAAFVAGFFAWRGVNQAEVVVAWSTASELETVGFNLYRSETSDGPFTKINDRLIPGSSDPLTGGAYEYLDKTVKPGMTYYYELEDIESNGGSSRFGPIEVTAQGGGIGEILLAAAFGLISVAAIYTLRTKPAPVDHAAPSSDG